MEKEMIKKISMIFGAILIVAALTVWLFSSLQGNVVPADFTAARQKAAAVSQEIVNITNETAKKIEAANRAETEGSIEKIMSIIDEAKSSNATAYDKAFQLSQAIKQMAESLNGMKPQRQQVGFEAVALELSLVSDFISYTGMLNEFLNNLAKSVSDGNSANRKATADSLASVNQKVAFINALNKSFTDKIAIFDQMQ